MTARMLSGIAVAVCAVLLVCSGLVGAMFGGGGGAGAACAIPVTSGSAPTADTASAPAAGHGPVGRWNAEQVSNAAAIVTVGAQRQVPPRGWVIALATAMQESTLVNLPGGDRDSVGLFQQRPSQGWGTAAQLQDPAYAAGKFFDKLLTVARWQTMPLTEAAQAVQRSAYPDAYAKWEPDATTLVQTLTGVTGDSARARSPSAPRAGPNLCEARSVPGSAPPPGRVTTASTSPCPRAPRSTPQPPGWFPGCGATPSTPTPAPTTAATATANRSSPAGAAGTSTSPTPAT
jgi:hypothetical protein